MNKLINVTILVTSFNRPNDIIYRCFQSIKWQLIPDNVNIDVYVAHDGPNNTGLKTICKDYGFKYFETHQTNNYANFQRQFLLEKANFFGSDYILFLDDDNIIYPNYIKTCLEEIKDFDYSICKIIHLGPLPPNHGTPPKVLDGNPTILQNVDTLQLFVKSIVMLENGWNQTGGYLADGMTIEEIAKKYNGVFINQILGVHC